MRYAALILLAIAGSSRADDLGLRVPPNFRVTLWADHTLADDIYTLALDEKGRVVVSGPGYVRRLEDTDGDGKADKAIDIASPKTGAMGLLFAFDSEHPDFDLYLSGEGKILGHNGLHKGDRYPVYHEMIKTWPFGEHGGHALKIGPDGFLYAIAGNDAKIGELSRRPTSPIHKPEGGGILRFRSYEKPDAEIIAHGFRNPYDFDFTPYGDIITYDSDTERDFLLPWYTPTRVYHVMPGAHHGWRLPGYMRSLARRDYYPDTVEMLADMGRGSPTGVCCYRHTQFPDHYRGGVFLLDWTFGKVYYLPLVPEGSSYTKVKPQVFLESTGTNGFAPTGIRVAPDGSLFISIGGRGTRGGVYRVEYRPNGEAPVIPHAGQDKPLDRVLNAPQPLEAWSQAIWIPLASEIIAEDFARVVVSESESPARRMRAMEILVDRKYGVHAFWAEAAMQSSSPLVRARIAWALGARDDFGTNNRLWTLAADRDARVRESALVSLDSTVQFLRLREELNLQTLAKCLADPDNRVRLAAARVASRLQSEPELRTAWNVSARALWDGADSRGLVGLIMSPSPTTPGELLPRALRALELAETPAQRVDAMRAIVLTMGDWNIAKPNVELFSAYSLNWADMKDPPFSRLITHSAARDLLGRFPAGDERENIEGSRLLAMWESDHPAAIDRMLAQITRDSHPTLDFHYLTVMSRLTAVPTEKQTRQVADALLGMEKKLAGRNLRIKQSWSARLAELAGELLKKYRGLDQILVGHPDFVQPGHVVIATQLRDPARTAAAKRFLTATRNDAEFPLSPELVDLMAALPAAEVRPVLRAHWSDFSVREPIIRQLVTKPDAPDRTRFLDVLETGSTEVARLSLEALSELPRDDSPKNLVPLLGRLRQSLSDPKEKLLRKELIALINRQSGQGFVLLEGKPGGGGLNAVYRPVFEWFAKAHPDEANRLAGPAEDEEAVRKMATQVKWEAGDIERGRKLFRDRGCQSCHGGSVRLGPDLTGVTKRFSRDDLLTALVNPSRDVALQYRVTNIDTKDGKRMSGIVVFESAEALIVQTGAAETRRVATEDIEGTSPSPKSLMPDGLLKGFRPEDLADLFAFLATL
jgi:putative heme-binding domain-containing protein